MEGNFFFFFFCVFFLLLCPPSAPPRVPLEKKKGIFKRKRKIAGVEPTDGCAIFYRSSKFVLISNHQFTLHNNKGERGVHVALGCNLQYLDKGEEGGGVATTTKDVYVLCTHLKSGSFTGTEHLRLEQVFFFIFLVYCCFN